MVVEKFLRRDFDPLMMIMTSFIDSFTTVVQVSTIHTEASLADLGGPVVIEASSRGRGQATI